jgi:crossover junction endodeoxyribonuclease RuvC
MDSLYLGIDPGSSSGCLCLLGKHSEFIKCLELSKYNESEVFDFLEKHKSNTIFAFLEKVHSMPGQGVSSAFKFGENYGFLKGVLVSLRIPFNEVQPSSWMKFYGMKREKEESKPQWKKRLHMRAKQLFPDMKLTRDMADAVLISYYCKVSNP